MQAGRSPASRHLYLSPDHIVRKVTHLPSSPRVLPRLKRLLVNGNSELQEIVDLIRLDQGLAMRALQVANSPYFFTGARCLTIEQAVARVGYNEIYSFVAHAAAIQVFNRPVAVYRIGADEMWANSVCCAIAAQTLAERVGVDPAAAYTLGLLHGVGMVAIDEWALRTGNPLRLVMLQYPHEATRSERMHLGFTHADVGAALLDHWAFPAEVSDPVRFQYAPAAATNWGALASLLLAARWVRSAVLTPVPGLIPPFPTLAQIRMAGLKATALTESVEQVSREFAEASSVLTFCNEPEIDREAFPSQQWQAQPQA